MKSNLRPNLKTKIFDLIQPWKESGQSVRKFCKSQSVSENAFRYWLKRYPQEMLQEKGNGFVKVQVDQRIISPKKGEVLILYPNGVEARVPVQAGHDLMMKLIKIY